MDISGDYLRQQSHPDGQAEWSDIKLFWVPDDHHGYIPVQQVADSDESQDFKTIRLPDNQVERVRRDSLLPANSSRYDKHEDMAELGELNEATILHCLKTRYQSGLIYTYSGLFLVAVNPYKSLPIYSPDVVEWFKGQSRQERPPHIYAVADAALADMMRSNQNHGESGAGKTENTKKVIQYLTSVTGGGQSGELEQKILSTNPILEAFGNAQTGKFVRIEFDSNGKIVGADIERYLLEKSRVTHRSSLERSFHIFYQLLSAPQDLLSQYKLTGKVEEYELLKRSNQKVDSIDDNEEFDQLLHSFKTMGITESEQDGIFKTLAAILHLGNIKLSASASGDQAVIADRSSITTLCELLSVDESEFEKALLNPILRAGKETIKQSRDVAQVTYSIESLCRTLYERLFSWLVERLNRALRVSKSSTTEGKPQFIGVLDIAGFEIFEKNSFEQLCINYTNEKLQQFYNHHMFVQEQEEYKREHVEWSFDDFGLDLQPTIDLLERYNPVGVFACLDEDCIVPKANDRSFTDKLCQLSKNKTDRLEALRFGNGFAISHYAGRVEYNTDGWLDKNKDPINDSLFKILSTSSDSLIAELSSMTENDGKGTIVKKGLFRTVAQRHRESLSALMTQLHSTKPHFVRCIVPNKEKKAGHLDAKLVLDQLKCNGVFEGIRVCRNGYPGRVSIEQFAKIYRLLISETSQRVFDPTELCRLVLERVGFQEGVDFKIGISKTTVLDDQRDAVLTKNAIVIQTLSKLKIAKHLIRRRNSQNDALITIGEFLPKYIRLKRSPFWQLFQHVRPLLNVARAETKISQLERELESVTEANKQRECLFEQEKIEYNRQMDILNDQKETLEQQLSALQVKLDESEIRNRGIEEELSRKKEELEQTKQRVLDELEPTIRELNDKLQSIESFRAQLQLEHDKLNTSHTAIVLELEETKSNNHRLCEEKGVLETKVTQYESDMSKLQSELSISHENNESLAAQLNTKTLEIESLHQQYSNLQLELQKLQTTSNDKEQSLNMTISILQQSIHDQQLVINDKESQLANNQTLIQSITESNQRLTDEKDKLSLTIQKLEMTITELNGHLTSKTEELQQANDKNTMQRVELDALQQTVETNNSTIDSKERTISEQLTIIANLEQSLNCRQSLIDEQSAQLNRTTADNTLLKHNIEQLEERLHLSDSQRQLLESQVKDDQQVIQKLSEEQKTTEKRLKELELTVLESKLNERPSSSLQEAMVRLVKESEARMAAIKGNHELERRIAELESLLLKSDNNTQQLQERENEELKKANQVIELEVTKERQRIDQLISQLNSIKQSLRQ